MAKQPSTDARDKARKVAPKLIDMTEKVVFGDIWEGKEFSKRDRSLITITALIALGKERQLKGHLVRALNNGVTREEIMEVFLQTAIYCGVPAAIDAFRNAREVFAEVDKK